MKLSISRDLDDLTPDQPSIDENIDNANQILKEYGDKLDRKEIPMWLTKIIIKIFGERGGKNVMDIIIARVIEEIQKTELDNQLYEIFSNIIKEQIPGEHFEPIIGTALIGIGEELKKEDTTK
jgi:uncharacterized membrane-anchored protein YjiN (DUF445 family)